MKMSVKLDATNAGEFVRNDVPATVELVVDESDHAFVYLEIDDSGAVKIATTDLVNAIRRLVPASAPSLASLFEGAFGIFPQGPLKR
jgi:hypothetical protein